MDKTSRDLLYGAIEELADVGQAAFTMDGVARRSFYSSGALYERWPDRAGLLADVADQVERRLAVDLRCCPDSEAVLRWLLYDGRAQLALAGEILIAGHASEAVVESARRLWTTVVEGTRAHLPPGMTWHATVVALGGALLDVIGLPGPRPPTGHIPWLLEACEVEREERRIAAPGLEPDGVVVPDVPRPSRSDPTAQALIASAKLVLSESGAEGFSTRRVSATAGVSTGAIYRRYSGRANLLADVLVSELAPDRYAWTRHLLVALTHDNPYWAAADVMSDQLLAASADLVSQRVLLQIGVAARTDPALRAQVQERVLTAHAARRGLFERLAQAEVMRGDVDPGVFAWGFQTEPVGVRVLLPLGIEIDVPAMRCSMRAILTAAAA